MFVPVGNIGGVNDWDGPESVLAGKPIAAAEELRAAAAGGRWELASHGLRHCDLRALPAPERRAQLLAAQERLSSLAGRPVLDLAYPFGLSDQAVRADARAAGYRMAFADSRRQAATASRSPACPSAARRAGRPSGSSSSRTSATSSDSLAGWRAGSPARGLKGWRS